MKLDGSDAVMKAIEDIAARMGGGAVEVGFMENATYPDGESVASVAWQNEYGSAAEHRPSRPFFRNMIAAKSPEWPDRLAAAARATNLDGDAALELLGESIADDLRESINEFTTPALSQRTIDEKGFDKPLIDTAVMIRAITSRLVND